MSEMTEQLKAPDAGDTTIRFDDLKSGLFRKKDDKEGKVFLALRHGDWTVPFPIDVDGKAYPFEIKEGKSYLPEPQDEIVIFTIDDLKPLGISKIEWHN